MVDTKPRPEVSEGLVAWMAPFRASFPVPTWQHVPVLIMGAILGPGRRRRAAHRGVRARSDLYQVSSPAEPRLPVEPGAGSLFAAALARPFRPDGSRDQWP